MRSLAQRLEVTPFIVVLAAFYALLARWSGQDDIVVGTPTAGRSRKETEGHRGLLHRRPGPAHARSTATLPLAELVERVRETSIGAYARQDAPLRAGRGRATRWSGRSADSPITQVNVVLRTEPVDPIVLGDLRLGLVEPEPESARRELSFSLRDRWRRMPMEFDVEYNRDLFDRAKRSSEMASAPSARSSWPPPPIPPCAFPNSRSATRRSARNPSPDGTHPTPTIPPSPSTRSWPPRPPARRTPSR